MTSIVLIEEQNLFRNSLGHLINSFDGCQTLFDAPTIENLPNNLPEQKPDIFILSVYDMEEDLKEKIKHIRENHELSRIIVLSEKLSWEDYELLVTEEVYAFFSTLASPDELESLLVDFDLYHPQHELLIDSTTRQELRNQDKPEVEEVVKLTKREFEVLNLVCQERTNHEISETLGLSIRTVETFRRSMIIKTGCKNMIGVILKVLGQSHNVSISKWECALAG